jgi:hypothetical protein
MRSVKLLAVVLVASSLSALAQLSADDAASDRKFMEKTQFLCEWAKTNASEGNKVTIRACTSSETSGAQQAWEDTLDWWQYWRDQDKTKGLQLERDFDSANAVRVARVKAAEDAVAAAEAKKQQAARVKASKEKLLRSIPTMSVPELCRVVRRGNTPQAIEELVSRNVFAPNETSLIASRKVALGMSEDAMLCSLGSPERANRSVGSWGVHIQYVYEGLTVYTENGKVTSWQD